MNKQIKERLPGQCLFMNENGEIMIIEYGKPGFSCSDLNSDNRNTNREIINNYNQRQGITDEQVKLMHKGAISGWDTLQIPCYPNRHEINVKNRCIFEIEIIRLGSFGENIYADVSLPANPYALADALDKIRITDEYTVYTTDVLSCELEYLEQFIAPNVNLYELNYLANRLTSLKKQELECFHGMVMMDAVRNEYTSIAVDRLINMTYSTENCMIVHEAHDDMTLGRFYVDNGFVPELDTLSDRIFSWLDYAKVGKYLRVREEGVFTPNGYVVRNGDISEEYKRSEIVTLEKMDYMILLCMMKGFNDPKCNNLKTFLNLPANDEEFIHAMEVVGTVSLNECILSVVDCIIPDLAEKINRSLYETGGASYRLVNELSRQLQQMNEENNILIYKAMLETVSDNFSLEEALDIACHIEAFSLIPEVSSPESYAVKEIQNSKIFEKEREVEGFIDLDAYGRFLMERDGIVETSYGMLASKNGQTVKQFIDHSSQQTML